MKESEDHVEFKSARHNYPYNGGKHTVFQGQSDFVRY